MFLKKCAVIGSALMILGLPVLAQASLVTINQTNEDSTVKITSSPSKFCSSSPPFYKYTPAHNQTSSSVIDVRTICQMPVGSGTCEADVYPSHYCDAGGVKSIAHVKINVSNLVVTSITMNDQNPEAAKFV